MGYALHRRRKIRKAINFSAEEWVQIQTNYRTANHHHLYRNITEYIRDLIIHAHVVTLQTLVNTDEYHRTFQGIGTNINQIAHKVNEDNAVSVSQLEEVQAQLKELQSMFNEWATLWREAQGN